jgi:hypothetical protein
MCGAARDNKAAEQQKDVLERQIPTAQGEKNKDARNGEVGRPDAEIRKDVQPAMSCRLVAAVPARGEARRIKQFRQKLEHQSGLFLTES